MALLPSNRRTRVTKHGHHTVLVDESFVREIRFNKINFTDDRACIVNAISITLVPRLDAQIDYALSVE
jgi:hypothetical protein